MEVLILTPELLMFGFVQLALMESKDEEGLGRPKIAKEPTVGRAEGAETLEEEEEEEEDEEEEDAEELVDDETAVRRS
jgi:hypothetical protein